MEYTGIDVEKLILPVGEEHVDYLHDESKTTGTAQTISFPASEEEVCAILSRMHEQGIPVTVQGNRTGLTAGCVPFGGHVLSMVKMTKVLGVRRGLQRVFKDLPPHRYQADPNEETAYIRVQPGLSLEAFREFIKTRGKSVAVQGRPGENGPSGDGEDILPVPGSEILSSMQEMYFPPDPTESSASLGGMTACNASGSKTYHYGPTRQYVEALRLALPDGDVLSIRRGECFAGGEDGRQFSLRTEGGRLIEGKIPSYRMPTCKNAAGYFAAPGMDMIDMIIGSDGTFGVLTELELRLIPMPKVILGTNLFFDTIPQAMKFSGIVKASCTALSAVEYYDKNALQIVRDHFPSIGTHEAECMLYLELHAGNHEDALGDVEKIVEALEKVGADAEQTHIAESPGDRANLLAMRHCVPETVNATIAARKREHPGLSKVATDMAVPDQHFMTVFDMYRHGLARNDLQYAVWGHFGDNHLHVNILPRDEEEMKKGKEMYVGWARIVTSMGGTVSAEHGTGKIKANLLHIMYGDEGIGEMAAVRRAFCPDEMIGRGNLFSTK